MPNQPSQSHHSPAVTAEQVKQALSQVIEPELHRDLISLGMVEGINIDSGRVSFTVVLTTPACPLRAQIEGEARAAVMAIPGVVDVAVKFDSRVPSGRGLLSQEQLPNVKNTVAVASGKGGVGKSTVSVNLAVALAQSGAKVGLLDADIYGPNIPLMMGFKGPVYRDEGGILPPEAHGVNIMSIGFFLDDKTPVVWRGPMVTGAIQQFLRDVDWGELDYLLVDLPPGTGDASLSLAQMVPLSGAVIVTTPQDVALSDVVKSIGMFQKLRVRILGVVENMSYFVCPHCLEHTDIFGHGGGRKMSEELKVPFLGEVPLETQVRIGGDTGQPIVVSHPDSTVAAAFRDVAGALAARISVESFRTSQLKVINV